MKEWLDAKVEANFSSQNSEILRCIRDKMEREAVNEVAA